MISLKAREKKRLLTISRCHLGVHMDGMRKTTKDARQDSWCPGRDSNREPAGQKRHCISQLARYVTAKLDAVYETY
jgi:hypothetical protein